MVSVLIAREAEDELLGPSKLIGTIALNAEYFSFSNFHLFECKILFQVEIYTDSTQEMSKWSLTTLNHLSCSGQPFTHYNKPPWSKYFRIVHVLPQYIIFGQIFGIFHWNYFYLHSIGFIFRGDFKKTLKGYLYFFIYLLLN